MTTTQLAPQLALTPTVVSYAELTAQCRADAYAECMSRGIRPQRKTGRSNKKEKAWKHALIVFSQVNGRPLALGDTLPRAYLKIKGETAADNLACIASRKDLPDVLHTLHLFPMPEGHDFRMIDLDSAFLTLHSPDRELRITMPRPDMVSVDDQESEDAHASLLFDSTAMHALTGVDPASPFHDRTPKRLKTLSTPGRDFTFTAGGQLLSSKGTKVEIDQLRYSPAEDLALVLEFKRGPLPNHIPLRQIGYASLFAQHLSRPAGEVMAALVVATDPLFVDTPTGRQYADTHHYYIHWFDISGDDLDAATLAQVDKVTIDLITVPVPARPTTQLNTTNRLGLVRACTSAPQ
jgi:hypothetical protein